MSRLLTLTIFLFSFQSISAQSYIGPEKEIRAILTSIDSFSYFFVNGMTDELVDCYTENGKILPTGMDIEEGREALYKYWTPNGPNTVAYHKITPIELRVLDDIAYDYGYYEGKTRLENGSLSSWKGKYTIIWHKLKGKWKMDIDIWNHINLPKEINALQYLLDSVYQANPSSVGMLFHVEAPDRGISWSSAAGNDKLESGNYLHPNAPVYAASNAKTFVSATILKLIEQGKIDLDQAIKTILTPSLTSMFENAGYNFKTIKIRHLLSHTSGINDYVDKEYFNIVDSLPSKQWTKQEQMNRSASLGGPFASPGEEYAYGDINYLLLTEIIEKETNQPFYTAMRSLLDYESLGMKDTWWAKFEEAPASSLPLPYQYNSKHGWDTYTVDPSFDLYGGGGLITTAKDLAIFFQSLFNGEIIKDKTLLQQMHTKTLPEKSNYGLGLMVLDFHGHKAYYHGGYWGTNVMYIPDFNMSIASFTLDRESRSINADLSKAILGRFSITDDASTKPHTEKDNISEVIKTLFDGMLESDSAKVKSVIHPDAIFQTVKENETERKAITSDVNRFINSIGSAPKGTLDERYTIKSINHDHALAQVWVPYEFYYKGEFSHKGNNLFTLFQDGTKWKILQLIDTRSK